MLQGESEMNLPDKKYAVIYADPPWSYHQHGTGPKSRGNAAQHYHTMTVDDICTLPVRQLAGGGAGLRPVYVGNVPDYPGCTAGNGSMGFYIQNSGVCLGKEVQVGRKFLRHGRLYSCERRGLLAWSNARIQGKSAGQKPCGTSSNRISDTGA